MNPTGTDWRPTIAPGVLERRARMLGRARAFFAARGIVEVDTPALSTFGVSDPNITGLSTTLAACDDQSYFLHTSPEYSMKRLLAAGAPDIYQICKVYRDHERGIRHQPEFSLVEWYRRGLSFADMIDETCAFIAEVCELQSSAAEQHHYRDLFAAACRLDPGAATVAELAGRAGELIDSLTPGLAERMGKDRNAWLDLLLSHVVVPGLPDRQLSIIHHYPAEQAALARIDPDDPDSAERFEVFFGRFELANGYRELTDVDEQRRRFERDNDLRRATGLPVIDPDPALLAALESGLPECSGVAVGFDRLVMIACGLERIDQAVSFAL